MTENSPLEKPATPQRLWLLFQKGILPERAWDRAHDMAGYTPTLENWRTFLDRLMLTLGVAFLLAGVVFFFAFNWADMPKFGKFALVQGATVVAVGLAFWLRLTTWGGRLALAAATVMIGVTLAVTGQAYQTGADNYRLFMLWALMITPWVVVSRWNVMWLAWLLLGNLSLTLYWWQVVGTDGQTFTLVIALGNFGALLAWQVVRRVGWFPFMREGRWAEYALGFLVFSYVTELMLDFYFNFNTSEVSLGQVAPLVYLLVTGGLLAYNLALEKDLAMVSMGAFSVLIVATTWVGKALFENADWADWFFLSLVMGLIVLALTITMAYGLRALQKHWEAAS